MRIEYCDSLDELSTERILDSRDLDNLLNRLQDEKAEWEENPDPDEVEEFTQDKADLLATLEEIKSECPEWAYGEVFIREDYWEDYCQQLAEDLGYISSEGNNPLFQCIDWGQWAELVKTDYSECSIGNETYYYRNC